MALAVEDMRAEMTEGEAPAPNPNARLIAEINRIIRDLDKLDRLGRPDYAAVGEEMGRSRSAFSAILNGGEPRASTLLSLARYARINPLRLYQAAEWVTVADVIDYIGDLYAHRLYEIAATPELLASVLNVADITPEELALLARSAEPTLELLAERRIGQARRLIAEGAAPYHPSAPDRSTENDARET